MRRDRFGGYHTGPHSLIAISLCESTGQSLLRGQPVRGLPCSTNPRGCTCRDRRSVLALEGLSAWVQTMRSRADMSVRTEC